MNHDTAGGSSSSFAADLAQAKKDRIPRMALRPDSEIPEEMDDIVVENVTMFRAEAMSEFGWWFACYFANGERVSFWIERQTRPARIAVHVTEHPAEWIDIDKERRG